MGLFRVWEEERFGIRWFSRINIFFSACCTLQWVTVLFLNTVFGKFLTDLKRFKLKTLNLNGATMGTVSSKLHNGAEVLF